jgi:ThiF family
MQLCAVPSQIRCVRCLWRPLLTCPLRLQDVGKPKAVVAAERINARVAGVRVTPHHARIEDMPLDFYASFTLIILGLDSLEARRYMNSVACSLLGACTANGPATQPSSRPDALLSCWPMLPSPCRPAPRTYSFTLP